MGHDPMLKYKVLFEVSLQIFLAWCAADLPWWGMVLVAYTIGGIINHSMTLAMHEISHNMAFHNNIFLNRIMGFIANLPLGIPSFVCVTAAIGNGRRPTAASSASLCAPRVLQAPCMSALSRRVIQGGGCGARAGWGVGGRGDAWATWSPTSAFGHASRFGCSPFLRCVSRTTGASSGTIRTTTSTRFVTGVRDRRCVSPPVS